MEPKLTNIIPVFYATDDNYAHYLSVSISSLIATSSPKQKYRVHVLYYHLSSANMITLQNLSTVNVNIQLVKMSRQIKNLHSEHSPLRGDYETLTIYFRLFIPTMFPEFHKVIYLDADTCVLDDIANLYNVDLQGNFIAAVPDSFAATHPTTIEYVEKVLGLNIKSYFNSGVLLMDLQALRDAHFVNNFLHLLSTYHLDVLAADQDYLNTICQNLFLSLDSSWNFQPSIRSSTPLEVKPHIVHYCFFEKPWHYNNIPYAEYFWKYAAETNFKNEFLQEQDSYTEKDKMREKQVLDGLLNHAKQVIKSNQGFKFLYESGKECPL